MTMLADRIDSLDWAALRAAIDARGYATTGPLLTPAECAEANALWDQPGAFRKHVVMARHSYGEGEYRYFDDPLPPLVRTLREQAYPHLAPLAAAWAPKIGLDHPIPPTHAEMRVLCAERGQRKPTPLLLRYEAGGYNALHQDLYGAVVFPLQLVVLLSDPRADFDGGEFLLVEQRPRKQSVGEAVALRQGEAVVFATADRPAKGPRGTHRVKLRHGVSRIRSGRRATLGVIFHDAA